MMEMKWLLCRGGIEWSFRQERRIVLPLWVCSLKESYFDYSKNSRADQSHK